MLLLFKTKTKKNNLYIKIINLKTHIFSRLEKLHLNM